MNTLKSIGATHYELASNKNFMNSNKKVMLRIHKDNSFAYLACSDELSAKLRNCDKSELSQLMSNIANLTIGKELEVPS